jgi:HEAT repeat protein
MSEAKLHPAVAKWLQQLEQGTLDERRHAVVELGLLGTKAAAAIPALAAELFDADVSIRRHAAWALGDLGEVAKPAHEALVQALRDTDAKVRAAVALCLAEIGTGEAVPALTKLVTHEKDSTVQKAASYALAQLSAERAVA